MSVLHPTSAPAVPASTTYMFTRAQLLNALEAYAAALPEPQQAEARRAVLEFLDPVHAGPAGLVWIRGS